MQWAAAVDRVEGPAAALPFLQRAQEVRPTAPEVLSALGAGLAAAGDMAQAVQVYLEALRHGPGDPVALVNVGLALETLGREDDAAAMYEEAVRVRPTELSRTSTWATSGSGAATSRGRSRPTAPRSATTPDSPVPTFTWACPWPTPAVWRRRSRRSTRHSSSPPATPNPGRDSPGRGRVTLLTVMTGTRPHALSAARARHRFTTAAPRCAPSSWPAPATRMLP